MSLQGIGHGLGRGIKLGFEDRYFKILTVIFAVASKRYTIAGFPPTDSGWSTGRRKNTGT